MDIRMAIASTEARGEAGEKQGRDTNKYLGSYTEQLLFEHLQKENPCKTKPPPVPRIITIRP